MTAYRVTDYKVRMALENGADRTVDGLVRVTNRPEHEVRSVLVELFPEEFGTPGVNVPYRDTATIDELVAYAQRIVDHQGIQALVDWEHWPRPCGCMGPRDGEPLCPCRMRGQLAHHKVAVLDRIDPAVAIQVMRKNIIKALSGH
jgi:hypothetical protein